MTSVRADIPAARSTVCGGLDVVNVGPAFCPRQDLPLLLSRHGWGASFRSPRNLNGPRSCAARLSGRVTQLSKQVPQRYVHGVVLLQGRLVIGRYEIARAAECFARSAVGFCVNALREKHSAKLAPGQGNEGARAGAPSVPRERLSVFYSTARRRLSTWATGSPRQASTDSGCSPAPSRGDQLEDAQALLRITRARSRSGVRPSRRWFYCCSHSTAPTACGAARRVHTHQDDLRPDAPARDAVHARAAVPISLREQRRSNRNMRT